MVVFCMSENPQKTKKVKVTIKVKLYLIAILLTVILVFISYVKYIDNSFFSNLKTKLNITSPNTVSNTQSPATKIDSKSTEVVEDNSKELYLAKILELESTINNNQNIIYTMKQASSQILYISLGYQLLDVLKTNKPYKAQKDVFMPFVKDSNIIKQLTLISHNEEVGVPTYVELSAKFKQTVYKDMYLANIYKEQSLSKYFNYYFSKLIMIVNTNNDHVPLTDIRYNLNEIQASLDSGDLEEARDLIVKTYIETAEVKSFLKQLERRIALDTAITLIKNNLYSYVNTRL